MGNHRWSSLQTPMTMKMAVVIFVVVVQQIQRSNAQQTYVNNKQLDCEKNYSNTQGFICNGPAPSCTSYLTYRSNPPFNSPVNIAYLLGADSADIVRLNKVSSAVDTIPIDNLVVVPVNCSCFSGGGSTDNTKNSYYQHNTTYVLRTTSETYFSVANNTYEGLTTCQSMIAQNPYNYRKLLPGMKIAVPLRCACPSSNQTSAGVNYLLTYLVTWGDTFASIADTFGVDNETIWLANELSSDSIIFPFTPILVPLKTEPTKINTSSPPPPPPSPPELPAVPVGDGSTSSRKWIFVGAGVGGAVLLLAALSGTLFWFSRRRRRRRREPVPVPPTPPAKGTGPAEYAAVPPESNSWSVSSEGVRYAIGSLTVYNFSELEKATGFFGESNRIKGSVYRGSFKGDDGAVKVLKGDVSGEINILKQINHSNIIRLSGYCVHGGNTYLVYEFAENGSLSDWLHSNSKTDISYSSFTLGWKQRVQVAHDIADAVNYLHNYTNPPYIHKNLKSSNVLLDSCLRSKVGNFGLARSVEENQDLQLTRHVVGTHGYMAPEYIENGLVTPKLDVFAFGVVLLELLSGREAAGRGHSGGADGGEELLSATIGEVVGGEDVREKLRRFVDPCLGNEYPLDLAYSLAPLAKNCVAQDLNSRPAMSEVFMTLSKILSSSMDWDPSDELGDSTSLSHG